MSAAAAAKRSVQDENESRATRASTSSSVKQTQYDDGLDALTSKTDSEEDSEYDDDDDDDEYNDADLDDEDDLAGQKRDDGDNRHNETSQPRPSDNRSPRSMGILSDRAHSVPSSPSQTFQRQMIAEQEEASTPSSPSKRHSRLGLHLPKLHFRQSSGHVKRDGGGSGGNAYAQKDDGMAADEIQKQEGRPSTSQLEESDALGLKRHSVDASSPRKNAMTHSGSKTSSGKLTPLHRDATGDFAEFLESEQLKEALQLEQEREIKKDLKAAKHPKGKKDGALGGKGKVQSPGDKLHEAEQTNDGSPRAIQENAEPTLEERGYFPGDLRHHGHLPKQAKRISRQNSHSSQRQSTRPPGICGPVSDSDAVDTSDSAEEALSSPGRERIKSSNASTASSSSASSDIAEPLSNPSIKSLKSWQSDQTDGKDSLASGGANPKLAQPLLKLEELELDSFLKNFGRHTREIRVPNSTAFPRTRLPQWEDFKVPTGEAALAAAQGKRVTVLTHVDRGLQQMAFSEGQGNPAMRTAGAKDKPSGKKKDKKTGKDGQASKDGHVSNEDSGTGADKPGQKVKFASKPSVFSSPAKKDHHKEPSDNTPRSPDMPFASLNQRSIELDEKEAKRQEKIVAENPNADLVNVHDDHTEWRPSRDEADMDAADWEILHTEQASEEVEVPETEDEKVDGIAWAIAYILASVERYAPEELDNSPDQRYREGKTRSHIERLYLIAPFWESFLFGVRRVYRWDNPRRTSSFMMIYFTLWYLNLIPTTFLCVLIFYVCQFRFFPPDASYLHEQVRARMARGIDADRLAERLRRRSRLDVLEIYKRFVVAYGQETQLACGDIADFHEKVKNLILWRNPQATWRTLTLLGVLTVAVTFVPSFYIWKTTYALLGFTFFILLVSGCYSIADLRGPPAQSVSVWHPQPLQSHYPRFRRPLSPIWWALWGAPTDAQFAIQLLRRRHLEKQHAKHPEAAQIDDEEGDRVHIKSSAGAMSSGIRNRFGKSSAAHAVAYGSMRPLRDNERGLIDLRDTKVQDGQITSKPRKLGSFFCQHHGVPGHLHVNTKMLYFVALHSHVNKEGKGRKTCKTSLEDISGLVKTKSIKLFVWSSSGLQVMRKQKGSLFFSNMPHRDNAFNLLLAVGSEGGCSPFDYVMSMSLTMSFLCPPQCGIESEKIHHPRQRLPLALALASLCLLCCFIVYYLLPLHSYVLLVAGCILFLCLNRIPHCHQLLRRCGMDGDSVIKVLLGRTHLDGNSKPLHHLIRAHADNVNAHYLLLFTLTDQLVRARLLVLQHTKVHWGEIALVDGDVLFTILFLCFCFRQTDCSRSRMGKDHSGDILIVEKVLSTYIVWSIHAIRQSSTSSNGNRCQQSFAAHIPKRGDTLYISLLELIDDNYSLVIGLDPSSVQTEVVGVGSSTDAPEQYVHFHRLASIEM